MKIEIPEKMVTTMILNELPGRWDDIGMVMQREKDKRKLKDFIVEKVLKQVGEIKLPTITDEELKQAVLARMADKAIENMKE